MKNGFTLVETLVALMIFGLLAAAGVAILSNSAETQGRVLDYSAIVQDMQRARAALRADLAQAAPRQTRSESGERLPAFLSGNGERLFALTRRGWENPDGAPRASLQFVEYRLVGDELQRFSRPMLDGSAFGEPAILARGITAAVVTFRDGDDWRETWDPKRGDAIPVAVQLDLTTRDFGVVRQLYLTQGAL